MGAIKFTGMIMLIALFSFSIIMFATDFATENNSYTNISNDQAITNNLQSINGSVEAFKTDANGTLVGFYKADFTGGADASTAPANLRVGNGSFTDMATTTLQTTYDSVFGGNPKVAIFLTALLSFLSISAVYYIWAAIKGGNVE